MKRSALLLLTALGCTSDPAPFSATAIDAAIETTADAPSDTQAEDSAAPKPDAPDDASSDPPADVHIEDAAQESEASTPCPADMVLVGPLCYDATEPTYQQVAAWLSTSPTPPTGCDAANLKQDTSILAKTTWCTAAGWCAASGKRLCEAQEWMDSCESGADQTMDKTTLDWEWFATIGSDVPPPAMIGDIGPPCQSKSISNAYTQERTERIRCCKDALP